MQKNTYFQGSQLSQSMRGSEANNLFMKVVNEGGNTLDLFTEDEGAMAFQQNDDYDSVVQR